VYRLTIIFVALSIFTCNIPEKKMNKDQFRKSLVEYLKTLPGEVSVSLDIPSGGVYIGINDTVVMHAASTMKVPVMIEAFRQAEEGKISLLDSLPVINRFSSIIDGSPYTLDISEDGGESLYARIGHKETVGNLIENMIQHSGNLATNTLIEYLGVSNIQTTVRSLGASEMKILRGVEDIKAFEAGKSNTTSARALTIIFKAILEGKAAGEKSTDQMISILLGQTYNEKIPAGLPAGLRVAHKTGSITEIDHDSGIIYPDGKAPYILTVLTRGFKESSQAKSSIADVSNMIYRWYMGE
jgi:beta-lactamase class A